MDVTCESCGTEYEFDETLVSDRGTSVKCTQCGHLFRVFPPTATAEPRPWQLWRVDGSQETVTSLRDLQRRIAEADLAPDDHIARTGERWKRLGDIAELQPFFQRARQKQPAASSVSSPANTPQRGRRDPTPLGMGAPAPSSRTASSPSQGQAAGSAATMPQAPKAPPSQGGAEPPTTPQSGPLGESEATPPGGVTPGQGPPQRAARRTMLGGVEAPGHSPSQPPQGPAQVPQQPAQTPQQPAQPAQPPAGRPPQPPASEPARVTPAAPAQGAWSEGPGIGSAQAGQGAAASTPAAGPAAPPSGGSSHGSDPFAGAPAGGRPLHLDSEDSEPLPVKRRGRLGTWLVLVLLIAAGGGAAWQWEHVAPVLGVATQQDRLARFVDQGNAALARDHRDAYEEAIREYTRATAIAEDDPDVLTGLARAHVEWAQALDFRAGDLEARNDKDTALEVKAEQLREEQARHARTARKYAERAVQQNAHYAPAEIVLANALRLRGKRVAARTHLEQAETMQREPSAEWLYTRALMAMSKPDGSVKAAVDDARRAVEADPGSLRARLLLARGLLAQQNVEAARSQIEAVLEREPGHPRAKALKRAMGKGIPPAAPVVEVLDGGTPDAASGTETAKADTERRADAPGDEGASPAPAAGSPETPAAATKDDTSAGPPANKGYDYYVRRGETLLQRGNVGEARAHFEKALEKRPDGPEARTGLGFVALNSGDASRAVQHFRPASQSGYADAYIGLGDAYRRTGRPEKALQAYEGYLDRRPNGAEASIAQHHVQQLQEIVAEGGGGSASDTTSDPPALGSEPQ